MSPGCANCYAETLSLRFGWSKLPWTPENAAANVVLHPERLNKPLSWRTPRRVFVNSMSDLFHELIPDEFVYSVLDVMAACPQHSFQVLTKRPERARDLLGRVDDLGPDWGTWSLEGADRMLNLDRDLWPRGRGLRNVWIGTSIENARFNGRADVLREVPAAVRFISAEPLLGPLIGARHHPDLSLVGIDWLIVGGESGHGHRPMLVEWARDLRDACAPVSTAFFFKQWGGRTPKSGGRLLDGREWSEYPTLCEQRRDPNSQSRPK